MVGESWASAMRECTMVWPSKTCWLCFMSFGGAPRNVLCTVVAAKELLLVGRHGRHERNAMGGPAPADFVKLSDQWALVCSCHGLIVHVLIVHGGADRI